MESQATAQKSGKVQVILGADIFCNLQSITADNTQLLASLD